MSTQQPTSKRGDAVCLVLILALATTFLAPALRPGYTLLPLGVEAGIAPWHKQVTQQPQNILLSDPFYTFYPRRHFFTTSLRQGSYPLWNPYIFDGHPVVGDTAAQTFYPLNFLAALFLSAARALPILAWFHLTLTGCSMFAFLRLLRLRPGPALFGAVAWMLNGNTVVWLENPHRLSTLAWMPAVFLCYELAIQKRRAWPGVVAGLLYGVSILGGHTQHALGIGLALAVYAFYRAVALSVRNRRLSVAPIGMAVLIGLWGVSIGAVQLLPTLQLTNMSHRNVMSVEQFLRTRWPLQHIVGLWVPDFYGNPVRFPYWGAKNYAEVTAYYGAFAFPLSLAALVWSRRAVGRFFGALLLLNILIATATPLARLVTWLPIARYFRLSNLIAYLPFFGAAAAAFGIQAAIRVERRRWRVWDVLLLIVFGLTAVTAVVAHGWMDEVSKRGGQISPLLWRTGVIWLLGLIGMGFVRRWPTFVTSLLIVLLAIDLVLWGMPFNPVNSLEILYPENEVTRWLRQDSSLYRVLPLQTDRVVFGPNVLSVFGFYETGGYSSLAIERHRQLIKAIDDEVAIWWMRANKNMLITSRFDPLFSMLNVKYVLTSHQLTQSLVSVDAAFDGCVEPGLPLEEGRPITQTFQALNSGLNRVDVAFVRDDNTSVQQPVRFLMWQEREGGELVADITADSAALQKQGAFVAFFAPIGDSSGQTFVWALKTEGEGSVAVCQAKGGAQGRPAFRAYSAQLRQVDVRQGTWIYENPNVLPRAYVGHRVELVTDKEAIQQLRKETFDPWHSTLVLSPATVELEALTQMPPSSSVTPASVVEYGPHRVVVDVRTTKPGVLVLSDAWYPDWRVTVDGREGDLLQVNYALRGVYVGSGEHRVVFRFHPSSLHTGLAIAGGSLLVAAVVMGISWRRR